MNIYVWFIFSTFPISKYHIYNYLHFLTCTLKIQQAINQMLESLPLSKKYILIFFLANLRLVKKHIPVSTAWAKVPWKTRRSFQTKDQQFRWWVYQRTFCQLSRLRYPFWIWQWGRDGQVGTTRKKNKDYTQISWFYKILSVKVQINVTENWLSIAILMFKHSSDIGTLEAFLKNLMANVRWPKSISGHLNSWI